MFLSPGLSVLIVFEPASKGPSELLPLELQKMFSGESNSSQQLDHAPLFRFFFNVTGSISFQSFILVSFVT